MTQKPEYYSRDLEEKRLNQLSKKLLDVLDEAHEYSESPNATAWFKGTANYGLAQGMLNVLHKSEDYPWITLANQTMDFTARIGHTLVQFIVDDPHTPRKQHRLKRNAVEQHQMSLNLNDDNLNTSLIWRFYLNPYSNGVDFSPSISLVGLDSNSNIVCLWEHNSIVTGPVIPVKPETIEIDEPTLVRKDKVAKKASSE